MSLDNLSKALMQEGKAEARKIISEAEKQASAEAVRAKDEAKEITAEARKKADEIVVAEQNERISAAKLKAKKIVSDATNRTIDSAMEKIWQEFVKLPSKDEYEAILKGLITSAEKELGNGIVHVNANDLRIAKKISKNVSDKPVDISGGAIVTSKSGKIIIDNSLESIFDSKRDDVRKIIFGEISVQSVHSVQGADK